MGVLAMLLLPVHRPVQADYVGITYHQSEQKHPTSSFFRIPFGDGPRHNSIRYTLFKHPHKCSMLGKNPLNSAQQLKQKTPITCSHQKKMQILNTLKTVLITGATSTQVSRGGSFWELQVNDNICHVLPTKRAQLSMVLLRHRLSVRLHVGFVLDCPTCACPTIRCNPDISSMMGWLILGAIPLIGKRFLSTSIQTSPNYIYTILSRTDQVRRHKKYPTFTP